MIIKKFRNTTETEVSRGKQDSQEWQQICRKARSVLTENLRETSTLKICTSSRDALAKGLVNQSPPIHAKDSPDARETEFYEEWYSADRLHRAQILKLWTPHQKIIQAGSEEHEVALYWLWLDGTYMQEVDRKRSFWVKTIPSLRNLWCRGSGYLKERKKSRPLGGHLFQMQQRLLFVF